jgi:hypothetical protein
MCIIIKSRCFAEVFQYVCIIFYATFRSILATWGTAYDSMAMSNGSPDGASCYR